MTKNDFSMQFDYIVIGAGISGLTFATLAAQKGARTLLVEQHSLPGGCFTAYRNGKYTFNVGLEWTTGCGAGQDFHSLLARLQMEELYPFRRVEKFKSIISPEMNCRVDIPTGRDHLCTNLSSAFPGQAGRIEKFVGDCVEIALNGVGAKAILMRCGLKPVEKMLASYFDDWPLQQLFHGLLCYPGARGVLLMYLVGAIALEQIYVPIHHDHRRLSALLYQRFRKLGGAAMLNTTVDKIFVDGSGIEGIRINGDTIVKANRVVATTDPAQLYSVLLADAIPTVEKPGELVGSAGLSCFSLFIGLKEELRGVQGGSTMTLLAEKAAQLADPNGLSGIPLRVERQSVEYPRLAPEGHETMCVWAASSISAFDYWGQGREVEYGDLDRHAYRSAKEVAAEMVLARLRAAFPGLNEAIDVLDVATPFTYKRYTKSMEGSVSGFNLADIQYLKNRSHDTPIERLYHIGHWTTQSGIGYAMHSATLLADSILG